MESKLVVLSIHIILRASSLGVVLSLLLSVGLCVCLTHRESLGASPHMTSLDSGGRNTACACARERRVYIDKKTCLAARLKRYIVALVVGHDTGAIHLYAFFCALARSASWWLERARRPTYRRIAIARETFGAHVALAITASSIDKEGLCIYDHIHNECSEHKCTRADGSECGMPRQSPLSEQQVK